MSYQSLSLPSFVQFRHHVFRYKSERTPAIGADYFPYDRKLKTRTKKLSQSHYHLVGRARYHDLVHQRIIEFQGRLRNAELLDGAFN
jgi:hypothetical protein